MNKTDEHTSWFTRLKHYLQGEPQNQDDLVELLRDAHERALINSDTLSIIESAIQFSQMQVRDVMVPKNQMICLKEAMTLPQVIDIVNGTGHSRFPVLADEDDEIQGILHAKDLLRFQQDDSEEFDLEDLCRPTTFVPESKRLDSLLREFRTTRNHMAIVVDEYGEVTGFVTIEDVIEQIIGEIEDEFDIDEEAHIKAHEDHYIVKAQMPIEEFNQALGTQFSDENYDTIGGIIMSQLGHLPHRGEKITLGQIEFKIISADARRIKLIECRLLAPDQIDKDEQEGSA